jgi:hypothetical protein
MRPIAVALTTLLAALALSACGDVETPVVPPVTVAADPRPVPPAPTCFSFSEEPTSSIAEAWIARFNNKPDVGADPEKALNTYEKLLVSLPAGPYCTGADATLAGILSKSLNGAIIDAKSLIANG